MTAYSETHEEELLESVTRLLATAATAIEAALDKPKELPKMRPDELIRDLWTAEEKLQSFRQKA